MAVKLTFKKVRASSEFRKKEFTGHAYGTRATVGLGENLFDEMSIFLAVQFPEEVEKAVFSTAFFAQQNMKKEWQNYARSSGRPSLLQQKRWFDIASGKGKSEKDYYGAPGDKTRDLGRAFQYRKYQGQGKAVIGWISPTAAKSGRAWQDGGTKIVTQKDVDTYKDAQALAGSAWQYQHHGTNGVRRQKGAGTKGKFQRLANGNIIPRVGAVIQFKRGGKKTPFLPHFMQKYESVLVSTLRRKIEEKLKLIPRGSTEVLIQADFDNVANGFKVAAAQFTQGAIHNLIAKQYGMFG